MILTTDEDDKNETRLIITKMGIFVLEGKVITGDNIGEKV